MDLSRFKQDNFIYFHNGIITDKNVSLNKLDINKNIELVIIHDIDSSCNIDLTINECIDANVLEIFYLHAKSDIEVNKNIVCKRNSNLNIITIEHSAPSFKAKVIVKTTLEDGAIVNNKKLALYLNEISEAETVDLVGEKSLYDNFNVLINTAKITQNSDLLVTHQGTDTNSVMRNYGISKWASTLNINTNGKVLRGAKRANVSQKSKGILLDIDSKISANPWLQIDEFDCLASHGAGIGAISEEELYYLMSRGLTRSESERIIIDGFVSPIYKDIKNVEIKSIVEELVKKYL